MLAFLRLPVSIVRALAALLSRRGYSRGRLSSRVPPTLDEQMDQILTVVERQEALWQHRFESRRR